MPAHHEPEPWNIYDEELADVLEVQRRKHRRTYHLKKRRMKAAGLEPPKPTPTLRKRLRDIT